MGDGLDLGRLFLTQRADQLDHPGVGAPDSVDVLVGKSNAEIVQRTSSVHQLGEAIGRPIASSPSASSSSLSTDLQLTITR